MTAGFQTFNNNAYLNITEDSKAYVYLKKYPFQYQYFYIPEPYPLNTIDAYMVVDCVGFPVVYFDIPYNETGIRELPNNAENSYNNYYERSGCSLRSIKNLGNNKWGIRISVNGTDHYPPLTPNSTGRTLYIYVFGRIDLNFPNGAGLNYGLQVFNPIENHIVFDANLKMFRLAGNTYNTELGLLGDVPNYNSGGGGSFMAPGVYDTVTNLPFSLENKAVHATARGAVYFPYLLNTYIEDGIQINQYEIGFFQTMYWATGSQLQARRIARNRAYLEIQGNPTIVSGVFQTVFSRLSVIDTTKFH